jgi:hypothetical protein
LNVLLMLHVKCRRRRLRCNDTLASTGGAQPSALELARFAAAMQDLRDAREEFDRLRAQNRP